jgi:AcrR family transcriptional regulator
MMDESRIEEYLQPGTKRRILEATTTMFAKRGFNGVSMRDIADAVDIQPASIYSHFASKEAILSAIYDVYDWHLSAVLPDVDQLLLELELGDEDPRTVLTKSTYYFDPSIQEFMDQTVVIAANESRNDERSAEFIKRVLLGTTGDITRRLLNRLLELGRIEPLDVEALVVVFTNYCFSAALRNYSAYPIGIEDWTRGYELLTQIIKPIDTRTEATRTAQDTQPEAARSKQGRKKGGKQGRR